MFFFSLDCRRNKAIASGVEEENFSSFYVIHFHWWHSVMYEVELKVMLIQQEELH